MMTLAIALALITLMTPYSNYTDRSYTPRNLALPSDFRHAIPVIGLDNIYIQSM